MQLPSKRQTLMWSATWPDDVNQLALALLREPATIAIGGAGHRANAAISQHFRAVADDTGRYSALSAFLNGHFDGGRFLVFCATHRRCDDLTRMLRLDGWPALGVHGGKCQMEREWVLGEFRSGSSPIMLATDVAARGLGDHPPHPPPSHPWC